MDKQFSGKQKSEFDDSTNLNSWSFCFRMKHSAGIFVRLEEVFFFSVKEYVKIHKECKEGQGAP